MKARLLEIEASIRADYDRVAAGEAVNELVRDFGIASAARRVLGGEIVTVSKTGVWISISFSSPNK